MVACCYVHNSPHSRIVGRATQAATSWGMTVRAVNKIIRAMSRQHAVHTHRVDRRMQERAVRRDGGTEGRKKKETKIGVLCTHRMDHDDSLADDY